MTGCKKTLLIALFSLLVLTDVVSAASWGPSENILSIEVGMTAVYFSSPSYTACGSSQVQLSWSTPGAKEMYATVLAAYLSGKPVKLYTDGCNGPYYVVKAVLF